jgi:nitric oxide dioxygenase
MSLQVELLEQSFDRVKPNADAFATTFYETLFADAPTAQPLFAHVGMEEQKIKIVKSLVFVVSNLRNSEKLVAGLEGLGARHVKYGALPEHYPLVGGALLKAFAHHLESDWTPEVKCAWVEAYDVITMLMLKGADYAAADVALPPI